jgi:hypothetical protein
VDRIINMMENMPELSDEQMVELQNEIISQFESVESEEPTPQTVEAMTSLADMLDSVRSEVQRREVQAEELAATASEASARVHGEEMEAATEQPEEDTDMEKMPEETEVEVETETPVEDDAEDMEKDEEKPVMASVETEEVPAAEEASTIAEEVIELSTEEPEVTEEAPVAEEAPVVEAELSTEETVELSTEEVVELSTEETVELSTEETVELSTEETETPIDAPVEVQEEATVTAAAFDAQDVTPEVPADRRPASMTTAIPVAITAGADIPGVTAGTELSNMSDVADAFAKRLHGLRRVNGGDGEQHIVASFSTAYPESMQLGSDAEANMEKIKGAPTALTASGSYQSPFATRYDIFGIGSNVRPVRDSLPSFQADRGGIRYIVPPVLSSYGNAVGVWTTALDTAYVTNSATSSATKANLVVTAATETTAVADAVTLQMQFGNLATRAYPELIARHNELGLIQHAREAEENLLSALSSGSTAVTSTNVLGLGVDFLLQVSRAASQYRARHRMADDAQLRLVAPAWVKDAIRADFALQMPGDNKLSVSDGEIEGFLRDRGVNATFHLDDSNAYASQGAQAMNEFSDTFVWYLFAEGTFLFLDGGTLDLGVIRDSTLVGTNDYKMFVETFEGIAKVGVESIKVTSTISINGARSALRDTLAGTASATVEF